MITVLLILLIIAFISGAPLFVVMLGGAALGALSIGRDFTQDFDGFVATMFGTGTGDQATVLSTIPLFIYAGYLLAESRTADRLVRFANAVLGWMPGGLAIVTISTCALFTVFTGASGVTIIALGGLLLPAMVKQGYPERFSLGLIAGTGSVGLLFPPALPLFIYGTVYGLTKLDPENWDTRRFMLAGIVPGLVLIAMLSAVAVAVAVVRKLPRQKFDVGELSKSFLAALPELAIPFAVIGLIANGFGLYEVAALTVTYVVLLEVVITKQLHRRMLWNLSRESLALIGAIFMIILASTAFTNYIITEQVPEHMIRWTQEHVHSKFVFLLAINVILLIVGTMMDIFSAIVVVLPLIAPIAKVYGVDPYHLGIIFLLNLEVGYLHPPVGINLFITSVKFQKPIVEVMWATVPFLITMLVALVVITYVPALTVVPEGERRGTVANLQVMVRESVSTVRSIQEVKLVDSTGKPLVDAAGKEVVKKLSDCEKLGEADIDKCKNLFFDVSACGEKPAAERDSCTHRAIAGWVVASEPRIIVSEVVLIDRAGRPVRGEDGQPITEKPSGSCEEGSLEEACTLLTEVSSCRINPPEASSAEECEREVISAWVASNKELINVEQVSLVDSDGKPVKDKKWATVQKAADCAARKDDDDDKEACRELFLTVSKCKIEKAAEDEIKSCEQDAISSWVDSNLTL
jgi:C4-dicarboxylate transporter, DctM subunit